jgi:cytochrome P450
LIVSFEKPSEWTVQLSVRQAPFPFRSIVTDGLPSLRLRISFKVGLKRLALRPFTFSNGVTIPAGTLLAVPLHSVHTDEEIYPNALEFDGFRFFKLREKEGDGVLAAGHQLVTTSPELLGFGLGRHAW